MGQSVVQLAKDLTLALIETGKVPPEAMRDTLQKTYTTLLTLKAQEECAAPTAGDGSVTRPPQSNWRTSITKHTVTCLACGKTLKQLSRRHLRMHGLTAQSYRATYGIPSTQPLAAKTVTAYRRKLVRDIRPWEKAPTFLKRQTQDGDSAAGPEADTLPEETEATSAAAAPPQPKGQRKTTTKKKALRKTRTLG